MEKITWKPEELAQSLPVKVGQIVVRRGGQTSYGFLRVSKVWKNGVFFTEDGTQWTATGKRWGSSGQYPYVRNFFKDETPDTIVEDQRVRDEEKRLKQEARAAQRKQDTADALAANAENRAKVTKIEGLFPLYTMPITQRNGSTEQLIFAANRRHDYFDDEMKYVLEVVGFRQYPDGTLDGYSTSASGTGNTLDEAIDALIFSARETAVSRILQTQDKNTDIDRSVA